MLEGQRPVAAGPFFKVFSYSLESKARKSFAADAREEVDHVSRERPITEDGRCVERRMEAKKAPLGQD